VRLFTSETVLLGGPHDKEVVMVLAADWIWTTIFVVVGIVLAFRLARVAAAKGRALSPLRARSRDDAPGRTDRRPPW
jgi:hypothetical protein